MRVRSWLPAIVAAVAVAGCSAATSTSSRPAAPSPGAAITTPDATTPTPTATRRYPLCHGTDFAVKMVEPVSGMTGEHAVIVQLVHGNGPGCSIRGYPTATFTDAAGRVVPFRVADGTGPYVTHRRPPWLNLGPAEPLLLMFAKYRCDVRSTRSAVAVSLGLPGLRRPVVVRLDRYPTFDYCAERPSETVYLSPLVDSEDQFS